MKLKKIFKKEVILLFFLFLSIINFPLCLSQNSNEIIIDTVYFDKNLQVSGGADFDSTFHLIKQEEKLSKINTLFKYMFGSIPEFSFNFILVLSLWILFALTSVWLLRKRFSKSIIFLSGIAISIILANLHIISFISGIITNYLTSIISRILLIILVSFIIFWEFYITYHKTLRSFTPCQKLIVFDHSQK